MSDDLTPRLIGTTSHTFVSQAKYDDALARIAALEAAIEEHRDAPDDVRFKAYVEGRFSAADTHLYSVLVPEGTDR